MKLFLFIFSFILSNFAFSKNLDRVNKKSETMNLEFIYSSKYIENMKISVFKSRYLPTQKGSFAMNLK
ncbi:MAG: hypothetical protein K2X69_13570 [Silvanigrellaceae bacterium]|nr:hypothetical protein [Silvanigrellaceae bacterium]